MTVTTWNPSDSTGVAFSGANYTATAINGNNGGARGTTSHATGKWYIEYDIHNPGQNNVSVGFANSSTGFEGSQVSGDYTVLIYPGSNVATPAGDFSVGFSVTDGDVISVAIDLTNNLVWYAQNGGNWNGSGTADPATGVGGLATTGGSFTGSPAPDIFPYMISQGGFSPPNAGATIVPGSLSPAFTYTPPTGFTGWDGTAPLSGTWASTESGDTMFTAGYPGAFGIVGDLQAFEGADTFAATVVGSITMTLSAAEFPDTFSAYVKQTVTVTAVFTATEGPDHMVAAGIGLGENGVWTSTEGPDIFAASVGSPVSGVFAAIEAPDTFSALGAGATRSTRRRQFFAT